MELRVGESGRQRVLKDKQKNVHAGVYGTLLKEKPRTKLSWIQAFYNPYKSKTFWDSNGNQIYKASYAILNEYGLWVTRD